MKKVLILALACLLAFPVGVLAKAEPEAKDADQAYIRYTGTIEDLVVGTKYDSILVKSDLNQGQEGWEKASLYTGTVPIMDLKTGELLEDYRFQKGEKIQYFVKGNTPILQSMPPKLTPDFVAVHLEDGKYSFDVDHFDKEGHGLANRLKINVSDETVAQNLKGEAQKDFLGEEGKDLAVLYTVATRSLPPITNPDKVLVLPENKKIVDLEDYKAEGDKGFYMRKYYEAMGAKVEWDGKDNLTRISLKDRYVDIINKDAALTIEDVVSKMEGFTVENGVSYISRESVEKINDYLFQ